MKVQGNVLLPGGREQVWELLTDPAKLAKLLPGCEKLEADGPDKYKVAIKFALAAISGKYSGSVQLSEQKKPESLRMVLEGKGTPGFMRGEGRIVLGMRGVPGADVLNSTLLNFFYRQVRFALLNAERGSQTQNLIYIDDLTKLYNNRYLNVVLDRELKRSERYRNFFSVLFMDLDFFKRINDSHGHLVGSRVLIEVGSVLRSCVRESDTVVRYGGDEFVVVLVETNADEAFLVAERMRKLIENKWFGLENGLNLHLTISIGIAASPEHASTKQHLLNMADQAMYRGKESTRNVVYLADIQAIP